MKIVFPDGIGRHRPVEPITLPDDSTEGDIVRAVQKVAREHLTSKDIDVDYVTQVGVEAVWIAAGWRPVGTAVIHRDAP